MAMTAPWEAARRPAAAGGDSVRHLLAGPGLAAGASPSPFVPSHPPGNALLGDLGQVQLPPEAQLEIRA